jgi:hypothetical protein
MAAQHGKGTALLVDQFDLSTYLNSADWSRTADVHETTTYGKDSKTYIPGLKDGSISAEGLHETAAGSTDPVLASALGATAGQIVSLLLQGQTQGGRAKIGRAELTGYDTSSPVSDIVSVSAEFQGDEGIWGGVVLSPLSAKTATGNGTTQDDTAATTAGWVANLHCTVVSGTTPTNTVKVQHSVDGTTWVDLGTFTAITAAGSQQLTGTGTVNRYVRAIHTIGGTTPSFTFAVTFARK